MLAVFLCLGMLPASAFGAVPDTLPLAPEEVGAQPGAQSADNPEAATPGPADTKPADPKLADPGLEDPEPEDPAAATPAAATPAAATPEAVTLDTPEQAATGPEVAAPVTATESESTLSSAPCVIHYDTGFNARTFWGFDSNTSSKNTFEYKLSLYESYADGQAQGLIAQKETSSGPTTGALPQQLEFDAVPGEHYFELKVTSIDYIDGQRLNYQTGGFFMVRPVLAGEQQAPDPDEPGDDPWEGVSGTQSYLIGCATINVAPRETGGTWTNAGHSIELKDWSGRPVSTSYRINAVTGQPAQGLRQAGFILITTDENLRYSWLVTPLEAGFEPIAGELMWTAEEIADLTSPASPTVAKKAVLDPSTGSSNLNTTGLANLRVKVTEGCPIGIYTKGTKHYVAFKEYPLVYQATEGGYDVYTGKVGRSFHVTFGGKDSGFLKSTILAGVTSGLSPFETVEIVIDGIPRAEAGYAEDRTMMSNMYLNVNEAEHLVLKQGETFGLLPLRTFQVQSGWVGNYFIEPDYHAELLGASDVASLTPKGTPGCEYFDITALQPGINVLRITYDDSGLFYGPNNISAQRPYVFSAQDDFNSYWPSNDVQYTGTVVVHVVPEGASNDVGLKTNIELSEGHTLYFDRAATDHATYTFTPEADAGDLQVRAHRPIQEGSSVWGEGWSDATANPDGSFTVPLYDGRNIIEVGSTASTWREYHVINAHGIGVVVENLSDPEWQPGQPFQAGQEARVAFDGIAIPIGKLAGIYNPGFPNTCWTQYDASFGELVRSAGTQYFIGKMQNNAIRFTIPGEEDVVLTGGIVRTGMIANGPWGSHRIKPGEGFEPNLSGGSFAAPIQGLLPDLIIPVGDEEAPVFDGTLDVQVDAPGGLQAAVEAALASFGVLATDVTGLTVHGTVNNDDFAYVKSTFNAPTANGASAFRVLDMGDCAVDGALTVKMVAAADYFNSSLKVESVVMPRLGDPYAMPAEMFRDSHALKSIDLSNVSAIG
ncbi:MAG: hypothetical protein LBD25_01600, partial [Coriobacteriales bacterium]|nr:hypothetical protein [Coriobacteriales bacterium]